jgi:anti-sigma factor RsiW
MNAHIEATRLHDYVERLLGEEEGAAVERHLESCDHCRDIVSELAELISDLASLPSEASVERDLWSGIESRIGQGSGPDIIELPVGRHTPPRRISATWGQLLAAGIVLATVSGGTVWMALRGDTAGGAPLAQAPSLGSAAVPAVQVADEQYREAITRLEDLLDEGRHLLLPETLAALERSLAAIEGAIEDARAALDEDPNSELLNRLLIDHQQSKLRVLEQAAAAIRL